METLRPASILPAIKCSTCGAEIEISSMGEHTCDSSQEKPAEDMTASPWERKPIGQSYVPAVQEPPSDSARITSITSDSSKSLRPLRTAPPRIDAAAANKPYVQRDLLTPSLNTGPIARAPLTPLSASRPVRSQPTRSMTSPVPRIYRPPSPQLSSNLDCAFPPFPTSRSASNPKPKQTSTYRPGSASNTLGADLHAEPESYLAPRSPRTTGGANVMQRMNTIAPGPFDARRRASDETSSSRRSPTPRASPASSNTEVREGSVRPSSPWGSPQQIYNPVQPTTPAFVAVAPPTNREGRPVPQRPVRPEPLDGFLAMLKNEIEVPAALPTIPAEVIRPESPSNSVATSSPVVEKQSDADAVSLRRPSEPGPRARRPTLTATSISAPISVPKVNDFDHRASRGSKETVPPLPPLSTVHAHSYQHTVHTPSDSSSSTSSTQSYTGSSFRYDMSPPISATSSVSMLSTTLGESTKDQEPSLAVPSLQIRSKPSLLRMETDGTKESSPPVVVQNDLQAKQKIPTHAQVQHREPSESPVVPTPGFRKDSPIPRVHPAPSVPLPFTPSSPAPSSPDVSRPLANRSLPKRPGTATKHHCRGCKEAIVGKSVKAADGRLTGRYHKHCFVCKTCQSPFATADFYVINNDPYCEQHYHQLNNSLCAKCDRGIEGPYLETQQGQKKFHLDCFTCLDCHKVLSDDYFEISGAVYCEQHAFTELRRQEGLGPKRNMERRTTRLMMMGPGH